NFSRRRKLRILMEIHYAELFEKFLHTRYVGQKRFSLEGAETLIPILDAIVEQAGDGGVREIVIGMSHRGRLNVLANILRKPYQDEERKEGIPLLIHGDAAFAGQGLVAETLNLSQLAGYTTGGTIHVVVNNQIGFTTSPNDARSTTYCTDVAKMIQAPIFHVNGEDPEAAVYVAELALDFRQTFKRDVVIDMFCYRRHGHNEADEPSYTQPIMYSKIRERPSLTSIYTEQLIMTGDMTVAETE